MQRQSVETQSVAYAGVSRKVRRGHSPFGDRLFQTVLLGAAWFVLLVVVALFVELIVAAWPGISSLGLRVLGNAKWDPNDGSFGVLAFVFGTLVTSAIALLVAGPIGIAVALFLSDLAPRWLRQPTGMLVELLAAVPSVVYGLWGLFVLAPVMRGYLEPALSKSLGFLPLFQGYFYGVGVLTAGMLLAIMVLPTVAAISRDVFNAVPIEQREAMLALGATRWEMLSKAVVPYARSGVIGALVLALGRALGEAMAVVMVVGNKPAISASLFAPGYTMASVLANEFTEATGQQYLAVLIEIGALLFIVSFIINAGARLMVRKVATERRAARG